MDLKLPPKRSTRWDGDRTEPEGSRTTRCSESRALSHRPRTSDPPATAEPASKRDRTALFVLSGPHLGTLFSLQQTSVVIGGDSDADVRLDDETVSARHARVTLHDERATVEDLASRNGTFVNERRIDGACRLVEGDHLRVGSASVFRFSVMDALEECALTTLLALTLRDPLTLLYNRRYFDDRLYREFSFARRHGTLLALLLIDIDHFKSVNDTGGHQIGDVVLKLVASTIERMMRPEDVLARFGGDEFIVIARATTLRNAEILAQRICHRVQALTLKLPNRELAITVSTGVAAMGPAAATASSETLLTTADEALYRAKAAGRNRVVACDVANDASPTDDPARRTQPPRG